jgi:Zn finger protein HypA/HybF involved in hydrogenase expression
MEIENPRLMKDTLVNINSGKKSRTALSIDLIAYSDNIIIKVNHRRSPFELAREIHEIFHSIVQSSKFVVLDISKLEYLGNSLYLTILNIALISKNKGIKFNIIFDTINMKCRSCYTYEDKYKIKCSLCFSQLQHIIRSAQ